MFTFIQQHLNLQAFLGIIILCLITPNYLSYISKLVAISYIVASFITFIKYSPNRLSVVLGLCYGDEGKGKVTKELNEPSKYSWYTKPLHVWIIEMKPVYCIRFGGANNAGHTVKYKGKNLVTHSVPTGIVHPGTIAIIGKGCLVNPIALKKEMEYLRQHGVTGDIYVDINTQVITDKHIKDDIMSEQLLASGETTVSSGANGSTKKGIRFCASDKALRTGKRVKECLELFEDVPGFITCNGQDMLMPKSKFNLFEIGKEIHAEGAQAYGLDPDTGKWPYVTSTGCNLSQVFTFGVLTNWLSDIWGVAKFPVTYVGKADFMRKLKDGSQCPDLVAFQKFPSCLERGSTTNRWRQVDYPNMDDLVNAINHNSITNLVINKMDVIEDVFNGNFPDNPKRDDPEFDFPEHPYPEILSLIIPNDNLEIENYEIRSDVDISDDYLIFQFPDVKSYKKFIEDYVYKHCPTLKKIIFSYSPSKL